MMKKINALVFATLIVLTGVVGIETAQSQTRQFNDPFFKTVSPPSVEAVPPFAIFDNLYYIGSNDVAAFVVKTSAGLIMIDSLYDDRLTDHVVRAIQQLGLNPKDVKYVIATHGHRDHFGGAKAIQALSGARVAMAEADWKLVEALSGPAAQAVPRRDMVVKDGDTI